MHLGHRCLLRQLEQQAATRGLKPVALTFDRHPLEVVSKDFVPSLLTTAEEKARLLKAYFCGDVVVLPFTPELSQLTAKEFMQEVLSKELDAEVLLMGYDHRFGHGGGTAEQYAEWGRECAIEVLQAEVLSGEKVSSSRIRRLMEAGNIADANALLGYPYFIEGMVTEGKQIGRTIGFPTANLELPKRKLCPGCGVYAVRVTLPDGTLRAGMLCIGHRPTVDTDGAVSIEVNILDFTGDLYNQALRLELVGKLRDERQFDSLDDLQQQLRHDATAVRALIHSLS